MERPAAHRSPAGRNREAAGGGSLAPGSQPLLREFAQLRITAIVPDDEDGQQLLRELQRVRAQVQASWPVPDQLPVDSDVTYCALVPDLARRVPWLPGEARTALVAVVPAGRPADLRALHDCAAHAVLHLPAQPQTVLTSLLLARSHFLYELRLRGRIEKLDDNLRTMRSVERAKAILMQQRSISETEAYHHLRRQAMERRVSIGALATAIVDAQELIG